MFTRFRALAGWLLSLPLMAAELKTLADFVEAARAAILAGNLDEAEEHTQKAKALKALEGLDPAPAAPPQRLPIASDEQDDSAGETARHAAIKTWYVKRFGELPKAAEQIARELYPGQNYLDATWAKHADFRRYLRYGVYDPALKSLVLLTPEQIINAAANGILVGEIKTTMVEAQDALGGYVVPEDFRTTIIERLPGLTVVRPLANVITTTRDRVTIPTSTGGDTQYTGAVRVTWVDETPTAGGATTNATFGQVGIPVHVVMADTALSNSLLEDSAFDLVGYLSRQYTTAMAIDEDTQFLVGDGGGRPAGVLRGTAANDTPHDSNVTTVNSGNASALTGDGVVKVPFGLAAQYRQAGAVWVMNKATRQAIELLKDGQGRYLMGNHDTSLIQGQSERLRGYPIRESESMPDDDANKYPIIFGDFSGYTIADRVGMSIKRYEDSATAKIDQVIYVARRRLGGQVTEGWRFVVLKVAS